MGSKILCIIPARSGSKGIKNKNIIEVGGHPLLSLTIKDACELKLHNLVDVVIVSTDCNKIASIAQKYGASVPFLRPKRISGDKAKSTDLILHALDYFKKEGKFFDAVLLMQPTSPLRGLDILAKAIKKFEKSGADSLISCYKEEYVNDLVMYHKKNDLLQPLNKDHNLGVRRQDHGEVYVRNGSIYIVKTSYLIKTNKIISDKPILIEMSKSDSINIDTVEDFNILEERLCK
jgi:CMP-N,N'-diacetyllegionaminic acid synthase